MVDTPGSGDVWQNMAPTFRPRWQAFKESMMNRSLRVSSPPGIGQIARHLSDSERVGEAQARRPNWALLSACLGA